MDRDGGQMRPVLTAGMGDLTDSDVLVEIGVGQEWLSGRGAEIAAPVKDALEASYQALAGAVEVRLETVAILEEVAKRSVTLWLRADAHRPSGETEAGATAQDSLLKFLARGTLTIIGWMDGPPQLRLGHVQQAISVLAAGTSPTNANARSGPSSGALVKAVRAWQAAKASFRPGDRVRILMHHGSTELDLAKKLDNPATLLVDKKLVSPPIDMIFVVEVPDYRGTGEWQLKHGEAHVIGTCEAGALDRFYQRDLDIRPGDALHCRVEFETAYGPDHEVLTERFRIVEVLEVLPARLRPAKVSQAPEQQKPEENFVEQIEGEFGVLTLRRLPIH